MALLKLSCLRGIAALAWPAVCIFAPSVVQAANIGPSQSQYCQIDFSGPIVSGDRARLVKALKDAREKDDTVNICLNSPGGDFSETLRIVNALVGEKGNWDTNGTVVDAGAECIAECAFIFMAGKHHEFHGISMPLRRLHINGKLAFRLPKTAAATGAVGEKELARAYSEAVKQVKALMETNSKVDLLDKNKPYPKTLSAKVLTLDDNELLPVDSIDQIGGWTIQLLGLPRPTALSSTVSEAHLQRACDNYNRWSYGKKPATAQSASQAAVKLVSSLYYTTAFKGFGQTADQYCIIWYFDSKVNGPKLDIAVYKNLKPGKDEYRSTPDSLKEYFDGTDQFGDNGQPVWSLFDPATKLDQLVQLLK